MARPSNIKTCAVGEDTVGIITDNGDMCLFTPTVALEIACSLMDIAKEQQPDIDVEAVMKAFRVSHPVIDKVTYIH